MTPSEQPQVHITQNGSSVQVPLEDWFREIAKDGARDAIVELSGLCPTGIDNAKKINRLTLAMAILTTALMATGILEGFNITSIL